MVSTSASYIDFGNQEGCTCKKVSAGASRAFVNFFLMAYYLSFGKSARILWEGENGYFIWNHFEERSWSLKGSSKDKLTRLWSWVLSLPVIAAVQSLSRVWLFGTPGTAARQASLSFTICRSLLKLMSTESVMPSSHLILCCPLLLLPPIPPSIRVFFNESTLPIRWPTYWSFSFSISPSNEHPGLISFRMDWLDLLAVQGTLKSLLQHHSSKESIFWCSAFFIVQLSHPYMTTGKTIALTRRTFVGKVMSLLFNMLCRLVITFLPRSKCLLISWLQSPSAVYEFSIQALGLGSAQSGINTIANRVNLQQSHPGSEEEVSETGGQVMSWLVNPCLVPIWQLLEHRLSPLGFLCIPQKGLGDFLSDGGLLKVRTRVEEANTDTSVMSTNINSLTGSLPV